MTAKEDVMTKRLPRTTMTWRFTNRMAPAHALYMPCRVGTWEAQLIEVVAKMFRGRAVMEVWFEAKEEVQQYGTDGTRRSFASVFLNCVLEELGVKFYYGEYGGNNAVCVNRP